MGERQGLQQVKFSLGFLYLLLFAMNHPSGFAQTLAVSVREQVGTLPKGRVMASMLTFSSSLDQMYGANSGRESLSDNLSQNITFKRITEEEAIRGNQLQGLFAANGVPLEESSGSLTGKINGQVQGKVPVLGFGITDSIGLFVSMPILTFQVRTQYQFQKSGSTVALISELRADDQNSVADELENALNSSLESKLADSGYRYESNVNRTLLGDAELTLMKVFQAGVAEPSSSVQAIVTLPTSQELDVADVYQLRGGDSRFGLGTRVAYQYPLPSRFQLNGSALAKVLFPTTQSRRIPTQSGEKLYEGLDPATAITGGEKFQLQSQIRYVFPSWVGLNMGLNWQRRMNDTLTGGLYASELYQEAATRSGYELLSTYFSVDLNSISSFLKGNFLLPALAEVAVNVPLAGRNAISEPVVQLQATLFF